jgi:hypothetical protein
MNRLVVREQLQVVESFREHFAVEDLPVDQRRLHSRLRRALRLLLNRPEERDQILDFRVGDVDDGRHASRRQALVKEPHELFVIPVPEAQHDGRPHLAAVSVRPVTPRTACLERFPSRRHVLLRRERDADEQSGRADRGECDRGSMIHHAYDATLAVPGSE